MAKKILVLVGGISRDSLNKKLFRAVRELAPAGLEIQDFPIETLPFFSQDLEQDPPQPVREMQTKIKEADAVLILTPEYNRSFPGVVKNAVDWGSRPYGQNLWKRKKMGIMGASMGNIGTFGAQQHLRQVLSVLDAHVMHQPEFYFNGSKAFDAQGKLSDEKVADFIRGHWKALTEWFGA